MSRIEDIEYYLESDRIWPPTVWADRCHPFIIALREILERLPGDVFEELDNLQFIVESKDMLGVSVPFERRIPIITDRLKEIEFKLDTIVIFEKSFQYSSKALVGLLVHEIAHCFGEGRGNHQEEEKRADEIAISWGFGNEIQQLELEKKRRNLVPTQKE